ncbi:MAG: hypothetical protein ACQERN_03165 [Thermodesulfobacteriota bacterium]
MVEGTQKNKKRGETLWTPKFAAICMTLMLIFMAEVFFDTWCGVQCRRTGYEIEQARARQTDLRTLQKKLQIERVRLTSPQALGQYAKNQLELITPSPEQVIILP